MFRLDPLEHDVQRAPQPTRRVQPPKGRRPGLADALLTALASARPGRGD